MVKFAVTLVKSETVVGQIMKGKTGRFVKAILYFLKASTCHACSVKITGKTVNHDNPKEMKGPYIIKYVGEGHFIDVLTKKLQKHK